MNEKKNGKQFLENFSHTPKKFINQHSWKVLLISSQFLKVTKFTNDISDQQSRIYIHL